MSCCKSYHSIAFKNSVYIICIIQCMFTILVSPTSYQYSEADADMDGLIGDQIPQYRATEVFWDFRHGLEGWANATSSEMDMMVYQRGGSLVADIVGPIPNMDSPPFDLEATDKHYVVLRFKYIGKATTASFYVRKYTEPSVWKDYRNTVWSSSDYVKVDFDIIGDGSYRTYYVPFYLEHQGRITQLRFLPAVSQPGYSVEIADSLSVDWIRISKAPTVMKVEGCTRFTSDSQATGGSPQSTRNSVDRNAFRRIRVRGSDLPGAKWSPSILCIDPIEAETTKLNGRSVGAASRLDIYHHDQWCNQGVSNKYFENDNFNALDTTGKIQQLNYAATYNCVREGGERITITGKNFGRQHAIVEIDGKQCTDVEHLRCTVPPGSAQPADITVMNGALLGLKHKTQYLSYATPVAPPNTIEVLNVAARSLDLDWNAPDYWDALTVTGYIISRRKKVETIWNDWGEDVVVGNMTHTTLVGLYPNTRYQFRIAALTEDQVFSENWLHIDLFGRRELSPGAVQGSWSSPTDTKQTLAWDIEFDMFNANNTRNHSSIYPGRRDGHIGIFGGEGSYGLTLVGDANVANCNSSFACCDSFDPGIGPSSCGTSMACSAVGTFGAQSISSWKQINGRTNPDKVYSNNWDPLTNIQQNNGIEIGQASSLLHPSLPSAPCGPALRLTGSASKLSGAAWYARKMQVREGFDTRFRFRLSNPSRHCKRMNDVHTNCRSRGGDGFAFVIQNQNALALGTNGAGLGYEGIKNSLAIEFDSFYNNEMLDPYENHVSIQTRGWRAPNSANHTYSLGYSVEIPDLSGSSATYDDTKGQVLGDAIHEVRIKYTPSFDETLLTSGKFLSSPWSVHFLENADYAGGGLSDWGTGMGIISIYIDDMFTPVFASPLNLEATLALDNGRAWIGFTAATGTSHYQVHDILSWQFLSLRETLNNFPPQIVNEVGSHECSQSSTVNGGDLQCVHP